MMDLDNEIERGNIDDSTEVVNDGDKIVYAELRFGPWTVEYHPEDDFKYSTYKPERYKVTGPYISDADPSDPEGEISFEVTMGALAAFSETFESWDYVETGDER